MSIRPPAAGRECETHGLFLLLPGGAAACQHMGGSQAASVEGGSRVQLVVTDSAVVCRERRVSLGSVETKEIQENR